MSVTITIRDESAYGDIHNELPLEFPSELITVRELIRERVYQEVHDFNLKKEQQAFHGLVQPTEAEKVINGLRVEYKMKRHKPIDWKKQFNEATKAFSSNGFFILIDNIQAESLDQQLQINSTSIISFIKLTPLVGG